MWIPTINVGYKSIVDLSFKPIGERSTSWVRLLEVVVLTKPLKT